MRFLALFCFAAAIGFGSAVSAGTVTHFGTEAAYNAATSGDTGSLTFDGLPTGPANGDFGFVDFNTIGSLTPDLILQGSDAITDTGDPSTPFNVGVLQGIMAAPTFAIGMEVISGSIDGINLFDGGGALVGSISGSFTGFVGLVSDMAFERFDLVPNVFTTIAPNAYDRVFLDSFRASTPAPVIPLPSSVLLLAGAIGIGGALARRKASRKASTA